MHIIPVVCLLLFPVYASSTEAGNEQMQQAKSRCERMSSIVERTASMKSRKHLTATSVRH